MRTEWLAVHVTAFGSPDRAERAVLEILLGVFFVNSGRICGRGAQLGWTLFWPIQAVFVVKEPLCDVGTSS